jgi:hypothetical protein
MISIYFECTTEEIIYQWTFTHCDSGCGGRASCQTGKSISKVCSNHCAIAIVPKEKAYAFVELVTERQADLALQEM